MASRPADVAAGDTPSVTRHFEEKRKIIIVLATSGLGGGTAPHHVDGSGSVVARPAGKSDDLRQ